MADEDPNSGRRAALPNTPDAIEIAMEAANQGAPPSHPAARLLDAQQRLVEQQISEVRTRQLWHMLLIALVCSLLLALAAMAVAASRSSSLVIEPFRVPANFAARGQGGEAIAAQLLDELSRMQEATSSDRAASRYSGNWDKDVDIALPQTGISFGELWRFLKRRLGREVRITGEVAQLPSGLRITARTDGGTARSFNGAPPDLDRLIQQAAESVYGATQAYRYSVYLAGKRRFPERERVLLELARHPDPNERKWGYSGLSTLRRRQGRMNESLLFAELAIGIDPDMPTALGNRIAYYEAVGQDETALRLSRELLRKGTVDEADAATGRVSSMTFLRASVDALIGSHVDVLRQAGPIALLASGPPTVDARVRIAAAVSKLHRPRHGLAVARNAIRWLEATDPTPLGRYYTGFALVETAAAAGDRTAILDGMRQLTSANDEMLPDPTRGGQIRFQMATQLRPALALGAAALGDFALADRLLAPTPLDCDRCLLARAQVAARAGRAPEAVRWYRAVIRAAPSLPIAYQELGQMVRASGQVQAADRLFAAANRLGPRWADPLKALGDSAAARGDDRRAVRLYARAVPLAPDWAALRLAWGDVLARRGKHKEARAQWRRAAGLELSETEKAALRSRLSRPAAAAAERSRSSGSGPSPPSGLQLPPSPPPLG